MLRTAQSLPPTGLSTLGFDPAVSRPSRQPATGLPGDYPDQTPTGWQRRACRWIRYASPPTLSGRTPTEWCRSCSLGCAQHAHCGWKPVIGQRPDECRPASVGATSSGVARGGPAGPWRCPDPHPARRRPGRASTPARSRGRSDTRRGRRSRTGRPVR